MWVGWVRESFAICETYEFDTDEDGVQNREYCVSSCVWRVFAVLDIRIHGHDRDAVVGLLGRRNATALPEDSGLDKNGMIGTIETFCYVSLALLMALTAF